MRSIEQTKINNQWSIILQKALLISCLLLSVQISFAQKVSTILSKDKLVIGEQVTLKISVEGLNATQVQQDFVFPDTINHLEILSDSIDRDGPDYIHTLTITSFDSGYWQFPSFDLFLSGNRKVSSQPVDIAVLPVDVSNMADYHDIKDILEIESENNWWIILAIVIIALLSLFAFLWYITNKKQERISIQMPTDITSLYEKLLQKLREWENTDLSQRTEVMTLFNDASQSVRSFTDIVYQQNTIHQTTGEYILQLKGKLQDTAIENNYFQFLRLADAVKFAKYHPPQTEISSGFPLLRKFIEQVYQQTKSRG